MKNLNYYLDLKYPIEILETEDGFVASHPDLPGCASFGDTAAEAIDSLTEVRKLWLEGQVTANGSAPEPRPEEGFSGKFVVRLPKWLHRTLDQEARRQSSSLNTFVVSLLSAGLRPRHVTESVPESWNEPTHIDESWEAAAPNKARWAMEQYLDQIGKKSRSEYMVVFGSICKRKPIREFRKHSEVFSDASVVQKKEPN